MENTSLLLSLTVYIKLALFMKHNLYLYVCICIGYLSVHIVSGIYPLHA